MAKDIKEEEGVEASVVSPGGGQIPVPRKIPRSEKSSKNDFPKIVIERFWNVCMVLDARVRAIRAPRSFFTQTQIAPYSCVFTHEDALLVSLKQLSST